MPSATDHQRRTGTAAAVAVLLVCAVATAAAAMLDLRVSGAHRAATSLDAGWLAGVPGLALAVPGALLLRGHLRHPVAWLLCGAGVWWTMDGLASSWLAFATTTTPALDGAALAFWAYQRLGAGLLLTLPLVLLLYPDGRLASGRWRVAALISLATTALLPVVILFVPSTIADAHAGATSPPAFHGVDLDLTTIYAPESFWRPVFGIAQALVPVSLVVPFAVVVHRYRAARGEVRTRMRWLLWAATVDLLVMLGVVVFPGWTGSLGLPVAVAVTGAAVAAGIARPHLLDIDRLLSGTVVYGGLSIAVLVVDVAVAGGIGLLMGERLAEREAALVALLVVSAVYAPLRERVWRLVRRLVLGEREDPYAVVSGLAERLEASDGPEAQLLAIARTAAETFRSPYVGVEVDRAGGERLLVEHGGRPDTVEALPIAYRSEEVGRLLLPPRARSRRLSGPDERLLADVVRQAAAAARSSHLAAELQVSREQIVAAREEERRRLRRDLHDGLGPALGAVVLGIETARNLAASDPRRADDLLRRARDDVAAALADVRRLVHDLRPPALDDVGLVAAVRQQAERVLPPTVTLHVEDAGRRPSDGAGDLGAATEVAAYRIVSEAVANVARHAGASRCTVTLDRDGDGCLVVKVRDDGVGISAEAAAGVGLISLRERAAELGGTCSVTCPPGGGTLVRAVLPASRRPRTMEVARG